jgi:murein DD-endopeptidase MepM/ murein hydrolase activator NlpD
VLAIAFSFCMPQIESRVESRDKQAPDDAEKSDEPCAKDQALKIDQRRIGDTEILSLGQCDLEDATITLTYDLENMEASHSSPYTVDLKTMREQNTSELVRFTRINKENKDHWDWHASYRYGNLGGKPDRDFVYELPYKNEKHEVEQTYFGKFSHQKGTAEEYAVDFRMPVGTTVCAMRGGRVVALRQDSDMGGGNKRYKPCDNYVVIRHDDGGYGMYAHLQYHGVLVRLGQQVVTGQPIALSGNTGFSSGPHLHFDVFTPLDGTTIESVPFVCRAGDKLLSKLKTRSFY